MYYRIRWNTSLSFKWITFEKFLFFVSISLLLNDRLLHWKRAPFSSLATIAPQLPDERIMIDPQNRKGSESLPKSLEYSIS